MVIYINIYLYYFKIIDFWKIVDTFDKEQETFNYLVKKGIKSKLNKESLIALYPPDNPNQKVLFYEFPLIKSTTKYKNGAKTKYDIPQYFEDMPEDFSIFCTIKEANLIKKSQNKSTEIDKSKKSKLEKDKENEKDNEKRENKEKENKKKKEVRNSNNKEEDILEEPLPNEKHKYCHLCKKFFDNYMIHINTKTHNDNRSKQKDTFKNINHIFKRINKFWDSHEDKKDMNKIKKNNISDLKLENLSEKEEDDNNKFKLKIFTQISQNVKEGCKAKKKLMINNSQLSTTQSLPIIQPKKRKKNDVIKNKPNINNKTINEFLINGKFVNIKKLDRENINFFDNCY